MRGPHWPTSALLPQMGRPRDIYRTQHMCSIHIYCSVHTVYVWWERCKELEAGEQRSMRTGGWWGPSLDNFWKSQLQLEAGDVDHAHSGDHLRLASHSVESRHILGNPKWRENLWNVYFFVIFFTQSETKIQLSTADSVLSKYGVISLFQTNLV